MRFWLHLFIAFLLLALHSLPASALIKVQTPVSKMYAGSASVILGKVKSVDPASGVVEATATTLKGDGAGEAIKIKLDNLPDAVKNVKEGSPVVLLLGRRSASNALSLADTWLFPEPAGSSKSNYLVRKELDLKQSFPGTTAALARALEELKSTGKSSMLEEASPDMFKGGTKDLGGVGAGATAVYTIKDGKAQTVVVVTAAGPKYFTADAAGLKPAAAVSAERPKSPVKDFPAAVGNFGEDDKPYAIVVKEDNIYRQSLDGSGEPADFLRLTGERITTYHKENPKWLAGASVAALDVNGDGKTDVLINTPSGPILLINRGFGAFFIDADIAKVLRTPAGAPLLTDKTLWTAADVDGDGQDDLIIVSETGAVTAVMNPKPAEKK